MCQTPDALTTQASLSDSERPLQPTQLSSRTPRVFLAVDVANVFYGRRDRSRIDFGALLDFASQQGELVRAAAYVVRNNDEGRERSLVTALRHMEYDRIQVRPLRQRPDGRHKSDVDTLLIMEVWEAALRGKVDLVVLATGDSDFIPLVEGLTSRGIDVWVLGPEQATAWELTIAATRFVRLDDVAAVIDGAHPEPAIPGGNAAVPHAA